MEKAKAKEHKGSYGNTKGKSANALYKSYKTHVMDKGKTPMSFPDWLKWAKDKGVIDGNYSADAVTSDVKDDVAPPVKGSIKKYTSVILLGVAVLVLYAAFKSEDGK